MAQSTMQVQIFSEKLHFSRKLLQIIDFRMQNILYYCVVLGTLKADSPISFKFLFSPVVVEKFEKMDKPFCIKLVHLSVRDRRYQFQGQES